MANDGKFPSEVVDLPSGGKCYPKDSPLRDGKLEVKYMTAKEEDILTSKNLISKGVVIERVLDSLILTEGVTCDDLVLGDKNALMVTARILAYGPEYTCEIKPGGEDSKPITHTFNLADCKFKELPKDIDYSSGQWELTLPASKKKVTTKLLTGKDEKIIADELKAIEKVSGLTTSEITTRLRYMVTSVDGDNSQAAINDFSQNCLARDSLAIRSFQTDIAPDIEMKQEIEWEGRIVKVDIPLTIQFFWPSTGG
tara:strand:+ start:64 stop:825 length:762 start_codon:yes stop_codon:yes gene_type:complete